MAFIRRHRLFLVPLFLAVIVAAGIVFLLRSGSEEPAPEEPANPIVTVHPWEEVVKARNDHMREWRVVRETQWVDPETGEMVIDEGVSTVREVGSGLCYQDGESNWQPSVAEWEATRTGFKADRTAYQVYFGASLGNGYTKVVGGKTLGMRAWSLVLSDGAQSVLVGLVDPNAAGYIDPHDPSKLVFPNAVAGGVRANLEYVLEKASFHQNIVLHAPIALPDGFNAETTHLYVFTELGLDDALAGTGVSVRQAGAEVATASEGDLTTPSEHEPIGFYLTEDLGEGRTRTSELFEFASSRVFDSAPGAAEETFAARHLWRDPSDQRTYLVERVSHAWLAEATYPATIDYRTISADLSDDPKWTADATYFISCDVNVGNHTLMIEPGTVIKFEDDVSLIGNSTSTIIAKGEPYGYIVFTSKHDDASGQEGPDSSGNPVAGKYNQAIKLGYSCGNSVIQYCKIAYATEGLELRCTLAEPIANNIISDCTKGIDLLDSSGNDVQNNLVVSCPTGFSVAGIEGPYRFSNNTFDGCGTAISLPDPTEGSIQIEVYHNLFTQLTSYAVTSGGTNSGLDIDTNAFWDTDPKYSGCSGDNDINLGGSPYESAATLGDYYLNNDSGGGAACRFAGFETYEEAGLDSEAFTVDPPEMVVTNISSPAVWSKNPSGANWSDLGVSIGYHHNRIDKRLPSWIMCSGDGYLVIGPGVVVAFDGSTARLGVSGTGELRCDGDPNNPITMVGGQVASMRIEAPVPGTNVDKAIRIESTANDAAVSITYTRFRGTDRGFQTHLSLTANQIRHCTFDRCRYAVFVNDASLTVKNLLVDNCEHTGLYCNSYGNAHTLSVHNCTFDRSSAGARFLDCGSTTFVITDCLFTRCTRGMDLYVAPGSWAAVDYNAYYDCTHDIWLQYIPGDGSIGENSIPLDDEEEGEECPYDQRWCSDPASADWQGQWYLIQDQQTYTTPCVNGGSQIVADAGLTGFPTNCDQTPDTGTVDIGYHYPDSTPSLRVLVDDTQSVDTGLAIYWPFDDKTADDFSRTTTSMDGTISGAQSVDGVRGLAYSFNGENDNISLALSDGDTLDITDKLTIEAWVRPDTIGAYEGIAIKTNSDGSAIRYGLRLSGDGTEYEGAADIESTLELATSENAAQTEEWTHVVATFDGTTLTLYENGTAVAETEARGGITGTPPPPSAGDDFWVGSKEFGSYFDGTIDEVKVYDRCLSAWEVSCLAGGVDYIVYTDQATISSSNTYELPLLIPDEVVSLYIETYDATFENPNGETISNPVRFTSLQDGINLVTIYGRDFAGNLSPPTTVMIVWDTEAPDKDEYDVDYTDISPDPDDDDFDSTTITVDFGEDVNYIVTISKDSTTYETWEGTGNYFEQEWDGGGNGQDNYTLKIDATDLAGNQAAAWTGPIRINNDDPVALKLENIANVTSTSFDIFWKNPTSWGDWLRYEIYLSQVEGDPEDGFDFQGDESMLLEVIDCEGDNTPHAYSVDWLTPGTTYYVKVVVRDTAGNPTPSDQCDQRSVTTKTTKDLLSRTWTMSGYSSDDESFLNSSVTLDDEVITDSDDNDPGLLRLADGSGQTYETEGSATFEFAVIEGEGEQRVVHDMRWLRLVCNADVPSGAGITFAIAVAEDDGGPPDTEDWTAISFPVAYWRLDEIDEEPIPDVTPDETDNEKHAQLPNSVDESNLVSGRFGNAISFNGSDEYLTAPDGGANDQFDITGDITLEAWVRFDSALVSQTILSKAESDFSGSLYRLLWEKGTPDYLKFEYLGETTSTEWTPETGRWYHIAGVYDSGAASGKENKLYIDGVLAQASAANPIPATSNQPVVLAARECASGQFDLYLDGDLDSVCIHPRALSRHEVSIHAHEELDLESFTFDPSDWIKVTATLTSNPEHTLTPKLYDLSIVYSDMSLDVDNDLLTEREERDEETDTDIFDADSDDDGLRDGFEVTYDFDPNVWDDPEDENTNDPDSDGLTNIEEHKYGTSPRSSDTDGDEVSDSDEIANGTDANGNHVSIDDFGPGSTSLSDPAWVGSPEIEVWGTTDSTLAWAILTVIKDPEEGKRKKGTEVRPHIYNGSELKVEKLPLAEGVTGLELKVHNIYQNKFPSEPGYTEKPEAVKGPIYVAYDPHVTVTFDIWPDEYETEIGSDGRHFLCEAPRSNYIKGRVQVASDGEYETVLITDIRFYLKDSEKGTVNFPDGTEDTYPQYSNTISFENEDNMMRMEADIAIDTSFDQVDNPDIFRTYHSHRAIASYYQFLLKVDAVDERQYPSSNDQVMTRQFWNRDWFSASPFESWMYGEKEFREKEGEGAWVYPDEADKTDIAYERSLVSIYDSSHTLVEAMGTTACDWVFQMPPYRTELLAPVAILKMRGENFDWERQPLPPATPQYCFSQTNPDVSQYTVMRNSLKTVGEQTPPWGAWYTTTDSLESYVPTSLTSTRPEFTTVWDYPGGMDAEGHHYGFGGDLGGYDFQWFYVVVEDFYETGDNESLIPNYIYVEGTTGVASAVISTDSSPLPDEDQHDWTEYDYGDLPKAFIYVRSGQSKGEDDFTDDTWQVEVGIDREEPWTLPEGTYGETVPIPLDVLYVWPDYENDDRAETTAHKTVFAQKGIVVRVQVPEEIWAGESRPLFATLNGKYNDGGSETGDVPWTYNIEWQFAEPVWEEEGTGEDITYTPTPPESAHDAEFTPSTILSGGHRVKEDTSPLYLGDMTSSAGGLAYVRAIIYGVNISNDEVVEGSGGAEITSAWVLVDCYEEIKAYNLTSAEETEYCAMFLNDDGTGRGEGYYSEADVMQSMLLTLPNGGLTQDEDELSLWINMGGALGFEEIPLYEDPENEYRFADDTPGYDIELVISDYTPLSDEVVDSFTVTVTCAALGLSSEQRVVSEKGTDTERFAVVWGTLTLAFSEAPDSQHADQLAATLGSGAGRSRSAVCIETGLSTSQYVDNWGTCYVEIINGLPLSPSEPDLLTVRVAASGIPFDDVNHKVRETGANTLYFSTRLMTGSGDADPVTPTCMSFFTMRSRRWPGIVGEQVPGTVVTPVEVVGVTCTNDEDGMPGSPPLITVGAGRQKPSGTLGGVDDYVAVETVPDMDVGIRLYRHADEQYSEDVFFFHRWIPHKMTYPAGGVPTICLELGYDAYAGKLSSEGVATLMFCYEETESLVELAPAYLHRLQLFLINELNIVTVGYYAPIKYETVVSIIADSLRTPRRVLFWDSHGQQQSVWDIEGDEETEVAFNKGYMQAVSKDGVRSVVPLLLARDLRAAVDAKEWKERYEANKRMLRVMFAMACDSAGPLEECQEWLHANVAIGWDYDAISYAYPGVHDFGKVPFIDGAHSAMAEFFFLESRDKDIEHAYEAFREEIEDFIRTDGQQALEKWNKGMEESDKVTRIAKPAVRWEKVSDDDKTLFLKIDWADQQK